MKLFPEDDNPEEKKKAAKETWSSFKQRFQNEWQPVNVVREAQMKIEQIKMMDRANEYVNRFRLIAMDTKYDNEALMKFFREGLLESLQNKIMLQTDGEPETLDEWYKLAIKYDNQYKLVMANRKKRELIKPKITRKEKEVMVGRMLSESDRKDYMIAGKGQAQQTLPPKYEPKKLSPQEAFIKIQVLIAKQGEGEQEEIFDLMEKEAKLNRNSMQIPIQYNVRTEIVETKALIDSGAGGCFICEEEARKLKKPWTKLEKPIKVFNVDGTQNKIGWITHSVTIDISIGDRSMEETLLISGLGPEWIILGLLWLQDHNPDIDWIMVKRLIKPFIGIFDETKELNTGILDKVEDNEVLIRSFIRGEEDSNKVRINAKLSTSQVLAQAHEVKAKPLEELLPPYLSDYSDRFEKKKAERFPPSRSYDHAIDLKLNFKPRDCKIYSLSPKEWIEQDKFLDENLQKGYIRPLKSPMASPFFFDYRDLNNGTIKNRYPLPLVTDLVDKLKTARVFMKLDLCNGYNNIWIKDGDQWKAAFKTPRGLFKPTVMFFGLTNSPATFQAFMNDILKDFIDEGWCVVYMDNILIFSDEINIHRLCTRHVLERLQENDLYLKPEKCEFEVAKTLFLGMVITPGHISMDKTKLARIKDWEAPKTVKGKYTELARPLHELTKKNMKFEWTKIRDVAFNILKVKFLQRPILQMPDDEKLFIIEADVSK
ncbi:reverse transcriptase-rnase h-integrase [Moniliophthora roreri MCA 2997]|uniref:Reverse transcriptase-rnase h-integrase n=1 Tax=Moniliophthora roreri (strain MCA 2997) TaxID=1381753 RepID=V2WSN7_MONRO|nr:reverse transcriptase-rnase h-integrase [Moniliophthora roreri MCA 2997]